MADKEKKGTEGAKRDAKGRFVKQPLDTLPGKRFSGERAREAARASAEKRREKGDLRRLLQIWLEGDVGTGKDGEAITGGEMMVRVAVKEAAKGNAKFWELIRDTAGFKPVDRVMVADVEPSVIAQVESMVEECSRD